MGSDRLWKWIGITTITFLAIFFVEGIIAEYKLAENHRFTVATTKGHGGGGSVNFEFSVNGVQYSRSNKGRSLMTNGRKYFVKYYVDDPSLMAKIVSDEEVPQCIGEPPPNGWKELPNCNDN